MSWEIPIIGKVIDYIGGYFERKQRISEAQTQAEIQSYQSAQDHAQKWEITAESRSDKFLRRVSFLLFVMPFLVAIVWPQHVQVYFEESLAVIPDWWRDTFIAITGSIWAISSLKNVVPQLVYKTRAAFRAARGGND